MVSQKVLTNTQYKTVDFISLIELFFIHILQ